MTHEEKKALIEGLMQKHLGKDNPTSTQDYLTESNLRIWYLKEHCEKMLSELIDIVEPKFDVTLKDEPWSLLHILEKLSDAARILLYQKDYDGKGWEDIQLCLEKAYEIRNQLSTPPKQQ